jgi:hypothetical protein
LKGAAECAGSENVGARWYSRNWNTALQRPTACRRWAAVRDELPTRTSSMFRFNPDAMRHLATGFAKRRGRSKREPPLFVVFGDVLSHEDFIVLKS